MAKPILILLRVADSNQPHTDKLRLMVLMVDYNIRISITELNDEEYFSPVTEFEDYEYEKGPGDDDPPEYLSDDEDLSDTEDVVTSQDKN